MPMHLVFGSRAYLTNEQLMITSRGATSARMVAEFRLVQTHHSLIYTVVPVQTSSHQPARISSRLKHGRRTLRPLQRPPDLFKARLDRPNSPTRPPGISTRTSRGTQPHSPDPSPMTTPLASYVLTSGRSPSVRSAQIPTPRFSTPNSPLFKRPGPLYPSRLAMQVCLFQDIMETMCTINMCICPLPTSSFRHGRRTFGTWG